MDPTADTSPEDDLTFRRKGRSEGGTQTLLGSPSITALELYHVETQSGDPS